MFMRKECKGFSVNLMDVKKIHTVDTLKEAMQLASEHVGNKDYIKLFPNKHTYFYGPGDGTTTVIIEELV